MADQLIHDLPIDQTFTAAPGQTQFRYAFRLFASQYLYAEVDGQPAVQAAAPSTRFDFSIGGAGDVEGGILTFGAPMLGGEKVRLYRRLSIERVTRLPNAGPVPMASFNREFDRIIGITQDIKAQLYGALRLAGGEQLEPLTRAQLVEMFKGNPGSNTSDVGTFTQARSMAIPIVAQTIRLSDRGKAVFERYGGALNLPRDYAAGENFWWFKDLLGAIFIAVAGERGVQLAALGVTPALSTITPHLEQAKAYCAALGKTAIILPVGVFKYTSQLLPGAGVSVVGPGSGLCVLERTTTNDGCFILQGDGATFSGFTVRDTVTTVRGNAAIQGHGVCVYLATRFKVDDIVIEGGAGGGVFTLGSTRGTIMRCHVRGIKADAFHFASGFGDRPCTDISVWGCTATDCGDDHFPVVSYQIDGARNARISFSQCYSFGGQARAFVSAGGDDITYVNCVAVNPALAGLAVLTDGTSGGLHGNTRITFTNCTVINGGSPNPANSYGAMHVFALGGADAVSVTFNNCHVSGSRNEGLHAYSSAGGTIRGLTVDGGNIAGCFYTGIWTVDVIDQRINNVRIQQTRGEALLLQNAKGNLRVVGNEWEAAGTAGTNECTITDGGLNGVRQIQFNSGRTGARQAEGLASAEFIAALIDGLQIAGNYDERGRAPKFGSTGNDRQLRRADADPASLANSTKTVTTSQLSGAAGSTPTKTEFDAVATRLNQVTDALADLISKHNTLTTDHNDLLTKMRDAGLVSA